MTKVLVLGASGQIARHVVSLLESDADVQLTLFVRHPRKLTHTPANARIAQGDVLDAVQLGGAMQGQDIVYANLTGEDLDAQARSVIASMQAMGVKRLIFVLSLGIYDEVPGKFGEWNNATIGPLLPNKPRSVPLATIARCSTVSTGACARAFPEPTFPSATGRQPLATIASFGGANSASGTGFLKRSQKRTTAICRWSVLRPFACTSTPSTSKRSSDEALTSSSSKAARMTAGAPPIWSPRSKAAES